MAPVGIPIHRVIEKLMAWSDMDIKMAKTCYHSPYFFSHVFKEFLMNSHGASDIGISESCMIWLHYTKDTRRWNGAKNFVTFGLEEKNEDVEVKECGVRLICDKDIEQEAHLSMLQGLPTPSQHGGMLRLRGPINCLLW
ncbi:hypothetical protein Tco_0686809 [Tanacetum coccineum]